MIVQSDELRMASVEVNPLRVTILFQDGSAFTYFEELGVVPEGEDTTGAWKSPFEAGTTPYVIVDTFQNGKLSAFAHEIGPVVAVVVEVRS